LSDPAPNDVALKPWLARQAYSLLLRLGMPAYLWRVWARGREEPAYRADWPWRLGWYGCAYRKAVVRLEGHPVLWLHAVSLGEARAAAPLVQALRAQRPGMRLLLTHTTATGREAGRGLLQDGDVQTWLPYDTPGAVRRFLRLHRPRVGVLMETEVWPNLQHEARRAGVPMVLANARLSEKSLRQGLRVGALMRPAAQAMSLCLAQTPDDAARLVRMGAPRVRVAGNVKFDMTPAATMLTQGQAWRVASARPLVLAASTREGEEPGLLAAWRGAWTSLPADEHRPRLWIVPRHPQRFDEVANLVREAGFSLSRRSVWPQGTPDAAAQLADVWLGDSMGEMPAYYAAARVALLGGSFAPLGGQNLIEAAACGCPVVMGPSTFNFAEAAALSEQAGAALRVADWAEGVTQALRVCEPTVQGPMSSCALTFAQTHRGAAQAMAEAIWATAGADD
jgi:3-deoxy-D-manno-octulosonic-acid transferase